MKQLLSPKQVARAIGVSESSLKRWCDQGLIRTERTAGGHRRMPIDSVLEFLREQGHHLVEPELLGLPAAAGRTEWTLERARRQLQDALVAGDEPVCRQIVFDLFLARHSISSICDQVIAEAFHEIGCQWDCGSVEVYQERRSCEISLRILHELRMALPQLPENAPRALGGTLDGDLYTLGVTMAELVLRDTGWNATSLGNSLPFATLRKAIHDMRPELFWLSVSFIRDEERFVDECLQLFQVITECDSVFAIGGQALTEPIRKRLRYHSYCDTMQHLETFARSQLPNRGKQAV